MPGASHLYASLTCSGALGEALGSSNYNFRSCLENHRFSFSLYMFSRFWHAKTSTYPPGPPGRAVVRSNFVRTWLQLTHWCPRWCQAVSHPTKNQGCWKFGLIHWYWHLQGLFGDQIPANNFLLHLSLDLSASHMALAILMTQFSDLRKLSAGHKQWASMYETLPCSSFQGGQILANNYHIILDRICRMTNVYSTLLLMFTLRCRVLWFQKTNIDKADIDIDPHFL